MGLHLPLATPVYFFFFSSLIQSIGVILKSGKVCNEGTDLAKFVCIIDWLLAIIWTLAVTDLAKPGGGKDLGILRRANTRGRAKMDVDSFLSRILTSVINR